MSHSKERAVQVLALFTLERPTWTAEQVASEVGIAVSSAYRIFRSLGSIGLVDTDAPGNYVLGPGIIQMDRQIRLTDPLLLAATPVMSELIEFAPDNTVMLLCRSFSDSVVCVHQMVRGLQPPISYERGRLRPLFKGATSKSILVFTPIRRLKKIYQTYAKDIEQAGLGADQSTFLATMRQLRKPGYVTANAEVDSGRFGISAPVLHRDRGAIGSLSYVIGADQADERTINRLASVLVTGARETERAMELSAPVKNVGKDGKRNADPDPQTPTVGDWA
jgi:DNA-binding IclR family transcriptional regulator